MNLTECNKCKIYKSGFGKDVEGRVEIIGEEIHIYVKDDNAEPGEVEAVIDFYDRRGLVRINCKLRYNHFTSATSEEEGKENWHIECILLKEVAVIQRQKNPRVSVEFPISFESTHGANTSGLILNISSGGMLLRTSSPLKRTENIKFNIRVDNEGDLNLKACVLRRQTVIGSVGEFDYGCCFIDIDKSDEKRIAEFVEKNM